MSNYFENKYSRNQINNAIENRYFLINEKNQDQTVPHPRMALHRVHHGLVRAADAP